MKNIDTVGSKMSDEISDENSKKKKKKDLYFKSDIELYDKLDYFHLVINYNDETKKKELKPPSGWLNSTKENPLYNTYNVFNNGTGIIMKQKTEKGYLICVDIDDKEDKDKTTGEIKKSNGLVAWKKLCKKYNYKTNTIKQKSGSGGEHYFYYVKEDDKDKIKSRNGIYIDGEQVSIDIKYDNAFMICEPSKYKTNDKINKYKFINSNLGDLEELPLWIFEIICNSKKNVNTNIEIKNDNKNKITNKKIPNEEEIKFIRKCIDLLPKKCKECFDDWIKIGALCYIYNIGVDVWDEWSKGVYNYGGNKETGCFGRWKYFQDGIKYTIDINTLMNLMYKYLGEKEAKELYIESNKIKSFNKILKHKKMDKLTISDIYNNGIVYKAETINTKFLSYKNEEIKEYVNPKNDMEKMNNFAIHFAKHLKALVLNSHLGSGKTQFILNVIKFCGFKRILFITHRQSLTYDLFSNFEEKLKFLEGNGFVNYLDKDDGVDYMNDKMIISIESLNKIFKEHEKYGYTEETIKYDLIVLDEIESLLYHMKSSTHKNKNMENYLLFRQICLNSDKIISMDGDICQRSLYFINSITNNYVYIKNIFKNNIKYHVYESLKIFDDKIIFNSIEDKQKIYMFCMETNEVHNYEKKVHEKNKDIKFHKIFGDMNDLDKKETFMNPSVEWLKYDFIATTSTTEAGVNFDPEDDKGDKIKHFDKICATLGKGCSQRQLLQGLSRVRNPKDNKNVYIHNKCYNYEMNYNFTTYNQIKDNPKYKELNFLYKNLCGYKDYIINSIFNDVEDRNKEHHFIEYLELLICEKGGEFIYIKKTEDEKRYEKGQNYKLENMINANFIEDKNKLEQMVKKQEFMKSTEQEKYDIRKTLFMRNSCNLMHHEIMEIEDVIVKQKQNKDDNTEHPLIYDKFIKATKELKNDNIVDNFLSLIDDENDKWKNDSNNLSLNDVSKKYKKEIIQDFLKIFNIVNFTEEHELINFKDTLFKKYKEMKIYTNKDIYKYDYDIFNTKDKDKSVKKIMGYLNTIFNSFGLDIKSKKEGKIQINEKWMNNMKYYINSLDTIDFVLRNIFRNNKYMEKKGKAVNNKIIDSQKILIKYKPVELSFDDFFDEYIPINRQETELILYGDTK
ncbi:DEXDc helicase-primase [Bodo saltans virus]|uniref:DEXDc helicase-primase n=1 Tax=Bodo saltans virus TaxID=2024608 RepID=A0A2H4UWD0_9VIRU|nr:DEXDc helicase-primase [Bodo saltans virus]ATZ81230.1 DEXDc helicase-primase [Bodo saltans virus]